MDGLQYGIDERVGENEAKLIEFNAGEKGEYGCRCSHLCGIAHPGMTGKVIVDDWKVVTSSSFFQPPPYLEHCADPVFAADKPKPPLILLSASPRPGG